MPKKRKPIVAKSIQVWIIAWHGDRDVAPEPQSVGSTRQEAWERFERLFPDCRSKWMRAHRVAITQSRGGG